MKYRFKYQGGWIATLLIISLFLVAIALGPVAVIWSLNTLFPVLAIPFNIYTWLATAILLVFVIPTVSTK
jgi:maltodextrin utilization protein YvdJ